MHSEAYNYVKQFAEGRQFSRVLEFGSLDINGSVRDLFNADIYLGVDLQGGPGVDIVADAMFFDHPIKFDCVVCCEVLEHAKYLGPNHPERSPQSQSWWLVHRDLRH
jgi:hypothetical protein